jgi:hypothetical protein
MFVSLDRPGDSEAASIKDKERSADYPEDYLIDTFYRRFCVLSHSNDEREHLLDIFARPQAERFR